MKKSNVEYILLEINTNLQSLLNKRYMVQKIVIGMGAESISLWKILRKNNNTA